MGGWREMEGKAKWKEGGEDESDWEIIFVCNEYSTWELAVHNSVTNYTHTEQTFSECFHHNESISEGTEASTGSPSHFYTIFSKWPQPTQHMNSPEINKKKCVGYYSMYTLTIACRLPLC